jgi:putative ABC transport system substrate-binding protein
VSIRRRDLITLLGGAAAAWPPAARGQQPDRMRRIGVLTGGVASDPISEATITAFRDGLAKIGWIEGRNLRTQIRFAGSDADRYRAYAAELVEANSEVIVVSFGAAMRAVEERTRTIPIIMAGAGDVAATGTVKNFASPEGNITGFVNLFASIGGKWLELLKEAAPRVERVAYLRNAATGASVEYYLTYIEEAARAFRVQVTTIQFRTAVDLVHAVDAFAAEPNGGLILNPAAAPTLDIRSAILQLAAQHRLPTIVSNPGINFAASDGLLISYGSDGVDLWRRAPTYVDRILRGAKVSELPVQYPTKFVLKINLKTAKALGLTIPFSLLANADEVIE